MVYITIIDTRDGFIIRRVFTLNSIHKKLYTMPRLFEDEIETTL